MFHNELQNNKSWELISISQFIEAGKVELTEINEEQHKRNFVIFVILCMEVSTHNVTKRTQSFFPEKNPVLKILGNHNARYGRKSDMFCADFAENFIPLASVSIRHRTLIFLIYHIPGIQNLTWKTWNVPWTIFQKCDNYVFLTF